MGSRVVAAAEVELIGELRPVSQGERGVSGAARFGVSCVALAGPEESLSDRNANEGVYFGRSLEEALKIAVHSRMRKAGVV